MLFLNTHMRWFKQHFFTFSPLSSISWTYKCQNQRKHAARNTLNIRILVDVYRNIFFLFSLLAECKAGIRFPRIEWKEKYTRRIFLPMKWGAEGLWDANGLNFCQHCHFHQRLRFFRLSHATVRSEQVWFNSIYRQARTGMMVVMNVFQILDPTLNKPGM